MNIQGSTFRKEPALECMYRGKSKIRNSKGFTFLALLAAITILGISMGAAGKYWQNVIQREKEEELLFRGDEYRKAIERYYSATPGLQQYPASIDDLLKDSRTVQGKRYLRRKYKDPMTEEAFAELRDRQTGRIVGVHSTSEKKPLKQANFPDAYQGMIGVGRSKYSEWQFISTIQTGTAIQAVAAPRIR